MNNPRGIFVVLLLVFAIRAMMPVGFMPDFSGKHLITICSGVDIKTIEVGEDGLPVSPDAPHSSQEQACPFSFLSASLSMSDLSAMDVIWFRAEFPEPVILSSDVLVHDLYHAGQFVLKHAPPVLS